MRAEPGRAALPPRPRLSQSPGRSSHASVTPGTWSIQTGVQDHGWRGPALLVTRVPRRPRPQTRLARTAGLSASRRCRRGAGGHVGAAQAAAGHSVDGPRDRVRVKVTWTPEIGPACVRASTTLENGSKERIDEGTTSHARAGGSQAQGGRPAPGRGVRAGATCSRSWRCQRRRITGGGRSLAG